MKKKIRETAEEILQEYTSCYSEVDEDCLVNMLNRLASDVAREVIGKIQSKIQIMISSIKAQEEIGSISEFNGGSKTALEIVFKDLAELKKRYESEKDNGNDTK